MSQDNNMAKFVCSSEDKNPWKLPPEEAAKQVFYSKEDAIQWFQEQHQEKEIKLGGYEDLDHTVHVVEINGKSVGRIDEYPDFT